MTKKASFGFQEVSAAEKEGLVQNVFSNVAKNYDLMNDMMSLGWHRIWKHDLINEISPSQHENLLDVAGGTGDIASRFLKAGGGHATVVDLNNQMLVEGQKKFPHAKISWVHANAENLPFPDNSFDYYTISFGIRNVTNIEQALKEAYRVLKPTGKFMCLEFSNVNNSVVAKLYDWYSLNIIPIIGEKIAQDREAYQYLVESIRKFPKAAKFASMVKAAGFTNVEFKKLTFGVVALHIGFL